VRYLKGGISTNKFTHLFPSNMPACAFQALGSTTGFRPWLAQDALSGLGNFFKKIKNKQKPRKYLYFCPLLMPPYRALPPSTLRASVFTPLNFVPLC
jgi:hypothetical protein